MNAEMSHARTSLLKNRLFRRLWISQAAALAALFALNFAAVVVVAERTLSVTQTGLVILSSIVPSFIGSLIGGAVVDRYGRARVLRASHLVRGAGALCFWFLATFTFAAWGPAPIYIVLFLSALVTQFATPAELSMLPDLVDGERLVSANSLLQISMLIAEGVGVVLIGPVLAKLAGAGAVGLAGLGLSLLAWVLVLPLPSGPARAVPRAGADELRALRRDIEAGWITIARDRLFLLVTIQMTLASVLLLVLLSIMPALTALYLGLHYTDISFLMIPGGVGFGVGAFLVSRMRARLAYPQWISAGLIAIGCAIGLMVILSGNEGIVYLFLLMGAIFGLGVALAMSLIPARAMIQERPAPEMRGRAIAAQLALVNALAVVPLLVGGAAADHLGVRPVMVVLALLAMGSGAAGLNRARV